MRIMRKAFLLLSIAIAAVGMPLAAIAHGGVEKTTGKTSVYITQSPISPLVGETVKFTFVLKQGVNTPLRNLPVTLTLIDTFYGDESKDKVILTEQKITDANGAFNFTYTFPKENYFDIDLQFTDPETGEKENTGFLIQPRFTNKTRTDYYTLASVTVGGVLLGFILRSFINKKKGQHENV